jgi:protein-arginine kinase activator protein McsA
MDKPEFLRKFCIIGLGSTEELKEDLTVISEKEVNFVSGEGLIIATFETAFVLPEIEELLKMTNRSYILFEMTMGFFSANIENKEFQEALFGGDINSSMTPYHMMEETLKNIRNGIFFTPEKISEILDNQSEGVTSKTDEELLEEALENENYEEAAKLRDKINKNK